MKKAVCKELLIYVFILLKKSLYYNHSNGALIVFFFFPRPLFLALFLESYVSQGPVRKAQTSDYLKQREFDGGNWLRSWWKS